MELPWWVTLGPDIPAAQIALTAAIFAVVPAIVVALIFGGRGILIGIALLALAVTAFLLDLVYSPPAPDATGMEGIALIVLPFMVGVAAICGLVAYLMVSAFGGLPRQRRRRRTMR
jgi:hypothetical protein